MTKKVISCFPLRCSKKIKKIVVYEKLNINIPSSVFVIASKIPLLRPFLFSREIVFHFPSKSQKRFISRLKTGKILVYTVYENNRKTV